MRSGVYRAERAVLRRLDSDGVGHLRGSQGSCRQVRGSAVDGLAACKSIATRRGHGIHVVRVHEINVANVRVEDISVADKSIAFVDPLKELVAAVEPRKERFAEAKREPADAEAKASAKETDKGRPIDRRAKNRARAPAPPSAKIVPSAIVVRSKSPRCIINPSPAPRADVVPVAIAIRSPAWGDIVGIPDVAVFRLILPGTVVIEIAVARRFARNILSGNRVVFLQVAVSGPAVEAVRTGSLVHNVVDVVVRAREFRALARMHFIGLAAGGNFAFAQFTDAEVDAAFGKAHLRDALVKVQEGESSHTAEMNGGCAGLQFGAGIFVHPKLVADSDRTVSGRAAPVTFSAGLQGNRTVNIADTRDARWGIFFFVGLRLRSRNAQKTGQTEHQP